MPRKVLGGLIQAASPITDPATPIDKIRQAVDRRAHPAHRGSRQAGRPDPRAAGDLQRPLLLPVPGRALVRHRRAGAGSDDRADGAVREEVPDGDGRAGLRARAGRRLLQHRRRLRHRRQLPREVPQEPHPAHLGLLGEVLLQARQPRLSGLQDALRDDRRLHLLRPALPGRRAPARPERRRDRLQPVGHGGGAVAVPVEARTAGARGGQRLLHGVQQPRRHRGALEHRPLLRLVLLRRSARQLPGDGLRGQGRARRRRDGPRHDRRSPARVAVLPRPPARLATAPMAEQLP